MLRRRKCSTNKVMDNRADEILRNMDQKLEGTPQEKLFFFKVDELRRNITRLGEFAPDCEVCDHFFPEAEGMAERIGDALAVQGEDRRELDRLIFRLSNHMMKAHGFFPRNQFTFRYSVWGLLLGLTAGIILSESFQPALWYAMPAVGLIAGWIAGQLAGRLRDRKIREAGKVM